MHSKKKPLSFLLGCLIFFACGLLLHFGQFSSYANSDAQSYVITGHEVYNNGDFKAAAKAYSKAIESGISNGYVLYNLGNAFYRLGLTGRAIAAYRKALLDLPRNADIIANLALARKKVEDKIVDPNKDAFTLNRLLVIPRYFSRHEMKVIALSFYIACFVIFVAITLKPNSAARGLLYFTIVITLLFGTSLVFSRPGRDGTPEFNFSLRKQSLFPATIAKPAVEVYAGDSTTFQVVFILHDGAEIEVGESRNNWVHIFLPDGNHGWVTANSLEII